MIFFHDLIRPAQNPVVVFLLLVSLLVVQSSQLHVHIYDHVDHANLNSLHNSDPHSSYELTIDDHADHNVEVDFTQQALAKMLLGDLPVIALFSILLLISLIGALRRQCWPLCNIPRTLRSFSVSPPLRAPPLSHSNS